MTKEIVVSEKWDRRFLALAEHVAQWSKDPSTKTGAVIVNPNNRVVSIGYNGFPRGIKDSLERLENREIKYKIIIHAERNAILFAQEPVVGYRLYTWPLMPCVPCASLIIQAGIIKVISSASDTNNPRWIEDFKLTKEILKEVGIQVKLL